MTWQQPGPGRPKLPPGEKLDRVLQIRMTSEEYEIVKAAARRQETAISVYFRDVVVDLARAEVAGEFD